MFARTLTAFVFSSAVVPWQPQQHDCRVHVLGRTNGEFEIRRVSVRDGDARVFIQSENVLSLILPWSAGQSGEVVQLSQGPVAFAARCEAGALVVTVQKQGVAPRALPRIEAAAAVRYRIRVSVTPGVGSGAVFIIAPDGSVARDTIAPPTDMFRGMVPLQPADVSITTEIREVAAGSVTGAAELRLGGPYFLATLEVPGAGKGDVIVDLGASRTLITREMLPPGVDASALVAVEQGPEGQRMRRGSMGALGGDISEVLAARLPALTIGDLSFADVRVNVVDSLPRIAGLTLVGIVGTDLLGAAPITRIRTGAVGGELALVTAAEAGPDLEVPFSRVGGLVLMSARTGDHSIPLILDTGARSTLLSESAARVLGLEEVPGRDSFRGLDGKPVDTWAAIIPTVSLGSGRLDSWRVNVASLPILEAIGIPDGGLLGQNLWERFAALEVDWVKGTVRFYGRTP
ncbi:MAG: retropepsin-like aspartic protease [Gemmatimonadales bacterium]|nr:retropepsin-like aspartic protease [Gemmatimonadales bacterium]